MLGVCTFNHSALGQFNKSPIWAGSPPAIGRLEPESGVTLSRENLFQLIFFLTFGAISLPLIAYLTILSRKDPDRFKELSSVLIDKHSKLAEIRVDVMATFGPAVFVFFLVVVCLGVWSAIFN